MKDLDFVVNYDLPEDPATYVHRVGRRLALVKKAKRFRLWAMKILSDSTNWKNF